MKLKAFVVDCQKMPVVCETSHCAIFCEILKRRQHFLLDPAKIKTTNFSQRAIVLDAVLAARGFLIRYYCDSILESKVTAIVKRNFDCIFFANRKTAIRVELDYA